MSLDEHQAYAEIMAKERPVYTVNTNQKPNEKPMLQENQVEKAATKKAEVNAQVNAVINQEKPARAFYPCPECGINFFSTKSRGCHIGRVNSRAASKLGKTKILRNSDGEAVKTVKFAAKPQGQSPATKTPVCDVIVYAVRDRLKISLAAVEETIVLMEGFTK